MEETQVWTKAFTAMHNKFEKWCTTQGIEMLPAKVAFQPTRKRNSNKIQEFIMTNQFIKNKRPISSVEVFAMYDNDHPTEKKSPQIKTQNFVPQEDMEVDKKPKVEWAVETKTKDFDYVNDLDFDTDTLINHFGEPQKTGDPDDFWTYEWKLTFEGGEFSIFDWVQDNASPHMTECWFISWDKQHNKQCDALMSWLSSN